MFRSITDRRALVERDVIDIAQNVFIAQQLCCKQQLNTNNVTIRAVIILLKVITVSL